MQAFHSSVKIVLIGSNRAVTEQIEQYLTDIKAYSFQLVKAQNCHEIADFIIQERPDLIFFVSDPQQNDDEIVLSTVCEIDAPIPIILFVPEAGCVEGFSLKAIDEWLVLAEISSALLEKTVYFTLERAKNHHKLDYLHQENINLGSQLTTTKNLFQTIIDNTSALVWMCDSKGNSTFFNQAWSRLFEQKIETSFETSWMLNVHPKDLLYCQNKFEQSLENAKGFKISYRLLSSNDEYRWMSNYAVPQFTVDEQFKGLVGYCFDITYHKKTEQKLIQRAASDRLLAKITRKIHASLELDRIITTTVEEVKQFLKAEEIKIFRVEGRSRLTLLYKSLAVASPTSCDLNELQQTPVELLERNLSKLWAGETVTQDFSKSPSPIVGRCSTMLVPILFQDKLWGLICFEDCSFLRSWSTEEINLLERVSMELSVAIRQAKLYQQLESVNQELEQLSTIDSLTQIPNRRKFDAYLAAEWERLTREQNQLSVILCDIDHFKFFNDTYGHQAGDRCLKKVAEAISRVTKRPADFVARYGGEEFVLVLPNTSVEGAKHLAKQIRLQVKSLKIPHISSPVDLYVTLSLGIACCVPRQDLDRSMLIAAADRGLYRAKAEGRDLAVVEWETEP